MTSLEDPVAVRRWAGSFTLVLLAHIAPMLVAACWLGSAMDVEVSEPAIIIDLAPPAAPPARPAEQPPGPRQVKAEAVRSKVEEDQVKVPLAPNPAVAIPIASLSARIEVPQAAPVTTAPAARPLPPALAPSSGKVTWQGLVLGRLEKFKRYPWSAQSRRQQGMPYIRFVMNREGKVTSSHLERSSGYSALDEEAVALPRRSQPLPRPPVEIAGDAIELVVPVEFFMR